MSPGASGLSAAQQDATALARPHALSIRALTKRYGHQLAVADVSIDVARGTFVTLLGPSGSGKTTILMAIAGFVPPTSGRILLDERDITALAPERRNFGMVFQGYALFPHMTVEENVWFPLRVRGLGLAQARKRVATMLELVQLGGLAQRLPAELSGGQQQRVALARALIFEPDLLLLDEPLSALDKRLRADLQWELTALQRRLGATFINVTHDQDEALSMSDEIVILREGRVEQTGSPAALYDRPTTQFVASFLGESNFIHGVVHSVEGDHFRYRVGDATFVQAGPPQPASADRSVLIALRPEKIRIGREPIEAPNVVAGRVADFKYFGATFFLQVATEPLGPVMVKSPASAPGFSPSIDARVWLCWSADAAMIVAPS